MFDCQVQIGLADLKGVIDSKVEVLSFVSLVDFCELLELVFVNQHHKGELNIFV